MSNPHIKFATNDLTGTGFSLIDFRRDVGNSEIWTIGGGITGVGSNDDFDLNISRDGSIQCTLTAAGDFGIGNTSAAHKLDVSGNINLTGSLKISGTDVLTTDTLGSGIVNSSIQNLGVQDSGLNMGTKNISNVNRITATFLNGPLEEPAQPNVTSVGTLTSLDVSGNVSIDSGVFFVNTGTNRVAIGTTAPNVDFEVSGIMRLTSASDHLQFTNDQIYISGNTGGSGELEFHTAGVQRGHFSSNGDFCLHTGNDYQVNDVSVLSSTTLGSGVVNSSLTSVGTLTGLTVSAEVGCDGIDVTTGNDYQINNVSVLNATTLGTAVVNSSLKNLGTQDTDLNMGTNDITNVSNVVTTGITADLITVTEGDVNFSKTGAYILDTLNGKIGLGLSDVEHDCIIHGKKDHNDLTQIEIENTNSGTAAMSSLRLTTDSGGFNFNAYSSGYTTSGAAVADGSALIAGAVSSGGLSIAAAASGSDIRFYTGGSTDSDLILQLDSNENIYMESTGALVVPRLTTTQRGTISSTENGMIIYNTTTNAFNFYENGAWVTK